MFVPVVNQNNEPLMPTTPSRARRWIKERKATPFWKKGVFCVRLNIKTEEEKQPIVVGVDPGGKKEGFTIKSESHTYLNIQTNAVTWVKDAIETRSMMRRNRRYRKCPYRKNKNNKRRGYSLPPSTKARWQWKLRILDWLKKLFPFTNIIVEDIKAESKKGQKKWNKSFSPLEQGKKWFYEECKKLGKLDTKEGWETKGLRDSLGLKKTSNKLSKSFDAHCVDSWVLANFIIGGHTEPDNMDILYLRPLRFHRRQLYMLKPSNGGIRKKYGGTMSLGMKRGSLVKHKKYGLCYVGGTSNERISLHNINGKRICQSSKVEDCKFLTNNSWGFPYND